MELPVYLKDAGEFARLLQGDVHAAGREAGWPRRVPRVRVGHEVVRSVRGRSAVGRRAAAAGRVLGRRRGHAPPNVFLTRLHVRYDNAHFPEDLVFQETADRTNFQGRYVLRHAWTGDGTCDAAASYRRSVGRAPGSGGAAAGAPDRMDGRGHPEEDGARRRPQVRAGRLVGTNLEEGWEVLIQQRC